MFTVFIPSQHLNYAPSATKFCLLVIGQPFPIPLGSGTRIGIGVNDKHIEYPVNLDWLQYECAAKSVNIFS